MNISTIDPTRTLFAACHVGRCRLLLLVLLILGLIGCQPGQGIDPDRPTPSPSTIPGDINAAQTTLARSTTTVLAESRATETGQVQPTATAMATSAHPAPNPTMTEIVLQLPTSVPVEIVAADLGQIAFYANREGNDEIYIMEGDGSQQTRLTTHPADDRFPQLSPDGRQVAFISNRDGNWEIYTMYIDGSRLTRLTNHPAQDRLPIWSPDGRQLAFSSDRDGAVNIYVVNVDGGNLTQLTYGPDRKGHPTWSQDGQWLAFNSGPAETEWEIYVTPATGGDMRRLTNNSVIDWAPSWSPRGNDILFLSKRPENADIYLMKADAADERNIFSGPGYEWGAVWAPDGKSIAFTSNQTGQDEIYTMRLDGTDLHRLTDVGGAYPSWSIKPPPDELAAMAQPTPPAHPTETPTIAVEQTSLPPDACQKPVEDYTRVIVNGEPVNRRTELMLDTAVILYGGPADLKRVTQGSYTDELTASFGTHAGGGAVDISLRNPAKPAERLFGEVEAMVRAMRLAGFAAWYRYADQLYPGMPPHIHAIAIGDQELSPAAQEQLTGPNGYFRGYNGLPVDPPIPDEHGGSVICDWMLELGYTDLR